MIENQRVPRRRRPPPLVLLGLVVGVLFALTSLHTPRTTDVVSAEVGAWTLAATGEPWLRTDGVRLSGGWEVEDLFTATRSDGRLVIARSAGPIAAAVPAYVAQRLLTGGDAVRRWSPVPGSLTAAVLGTLALLLLAGSIPRTVPRTAVLTGALALALTTPYWTVVGAALWPHTVTALGVGGMAWAAQRERWWLVGVFGAVGVAGRLHVAVVVAVLGLAVALARRRPAIALKVAATSLPGVGLLSLWGHWLYGSWSPTTGYAAGGLASWPATRSGWQQLGDVAGALVSPGYGLLVWTPVLLVVAPAVVRGWRDAPDWTRALAVGGVLYLLVQLYLNPFHGGSGFWGYRLPIEAVCAAFPLVMVSLHRLGRAARLLLVPVLGYQLGTIALGAVTGVQLQYDAAWGWRHYTVGTAFAQAPGVVALFVVAGLLLACLARARLRAA